MRKNTKEIFKAWFINRHKSGKSISTNGETIYSYSTPILMRENGKVRLNIKKYSATTSRQQSDLKVLLNNHGIGYSTFEK